MPVRPGDFVSKALLFIRIYLCSQNTPHHHFGSFDRTQESCVAKCRQSYISGFIQIRKTKEAQLCNGLLLQCGCSVKLSFTFHAEP